MKIFELRAIVICALLCLTAASLRAQKKPSQKFNDAIKRSKTAAEWIDKLAQLRQNGIPNELIDKAEAIGVFPCTKTDLLFEHAVTCRGVISRHFPEGWGLPAYYRVVGGGFGRPDPALNDATAVILLFMDKDAIAWLNKAISLEDEKAAVAGPLGAMTDEHKANLSKVHIIAYSFRKNGLLGRDLTGGGVFRGIFLGQDKSIHENLYGIRGPEVLAGNNIPSTSLPIGITAFQQALQKYYSR